MLNTNVDEISELTDRYLDSNRAMSLTSLPEIVACCNSEKNGCVTTKPNKDLVSLL